LRSTTLPGEIRGVGFDYDRFSEIPDFARLQHKYGTRHFTIMPVLTAKAPRLRNRQSTSSRPTTEK